MAKTTRKTAIEKAKANIEANAEVIAETEIKEENVTTSDKEVVEDTKPKKEKRKFEATDGVRCRSIFAGELFMEGIKSNILYDFATRNDEVEIEYQDLVASVRSNTPYISKPLIIVEDEDFINEFPQLKKIYESMYSYRDLKDILYLPLGEMVNAINGLPDGAKESIKKIAATQINSGLLDSVKKINALDDIFNTKLINLTDLFEV